MQSAPALVVRKGTPDDLTALVQCDDYARENPARREVLHQWLRDEHCLLAEADGKPVGFVVLERNFFGHDFIPLICVASGARRRGIGLRLLEAAEMQCVTPKLFTSTNASNAPAQGLFTRAGFVRSGVIENLDPGDPEFIFFKPVQQVNVQTRPSSPSAHVD